ncbi:hypothetical protein FJ651_06170 [Paucihalobacter ruber]|uniref:Prepilin type IV endopeptidase peptidase domain-containing protein n=1 Tax=Paucihalobacter ruber TaxID=2567861 RepID=A0A506PN95_9FLAO|nr:hypothetical protein [Paucihalobacter ruber]TPV35104.1 hypothetical protein FJ651_06170 [Paucihalobacter ruber]
MNVFLFPAVSILGGWLYWSNTITRVYLLNITINVLFVSILFLTIVLYAKFKLKQPVTAVFGLGDVLFFLGLSAMFATVSFMVIMISALLFSLVTHLILKNKQADDSVPLAGYMSLFIFGCFVVIWLELYNYQYSF